MNFASIKGQDFAINILKNILKERRIANFYIFYGQESIGKETTAKAFAKALNCKNLKNYDACDNCIICRRIDNNNFTDLRVINPDGMYIKIEQVREIIKDINLRPTESIYKIYIICDAHRMRIEAANAFLKILEEPPTYGILIFITTQIEALPQTILSRAQKIKFREVSAKDIKLILDSQKGKEGYDKILPFICMGKPGEAIRENVELVKKRDELLSIFLNFLKEDTILLLKSTEELIEVSKKYQQKDKNDREAISAILEQMLILVRDLTLFKIAKKLIINNDKMGIIEEIAAYFSISALVEIISLIRDAKSYILRNANPYLTLIVLFIKIKKIMNNRSKSE